MDFITNSDIIEGVQIVRPKQFADERGVFMEIFRHEWFPQVDWTKLQSNRSISKARVLRGLHYHFHQIDYWYCTHGQIRAGLVDLRPKSPTYKAAMTVDMGDNEPVGIFIPVGVGHGFYAKTDCTLIYYVNNYYDSTDEHGVAWNDPAINLGWGVDGEPLISDRDANNPLMANIPDNLIPVAQP